MPGWNSIEEMLDALHKKDCRYVILRNYEEIDADNFYSSGHADIDFLTDRGKAFARIIQARPRFDTDDGIHYIVVIAGSQVVIDVRSVGDGYYDARWEKTILTARQLVDGRFYAVDPMNYYYSLTYHAILQKKALADDYLKRLNLMAKELSIPAASEQQHLKALERFMKEHRYFYTLPYDIHVPLRRELIDTAMVKKQGNVAMRDAKIRLMQIGSRIKRRILRR